MPNGQPTKHKTDRRKNRGQETRERLFKHQEEHEQQEDRDQDKEENQHKINPSRTDECAGNEVGKFNGCKFLALEASLV